MLNRKKFIHSNAIALLGSVFYSRLKASGITSVLQIKDGQFGDGFGNATNCPPYMLWQWMNGCVTKEGITYDLEAFKKAGINDVQQFLIGGTEADINDPEITVLGDKWMELMRFALDECNRLGMTFGTHNCPGWSASGAPGLLPEDSMQKLVWTKKLVRSEDSLTTVIPPFEPDSRWNFYKDICLVAVPAGSDTVAKESVLVLTDYFTAQHHLRQPLPAGEWLLFRFGHTTTGHMNETGPVSGQGLEVDKMSKEALEKFWALYPGKLVEMAGAYAGKTFRRFEIDSFEAGEQTWTKKMAEEFKSRCGYDVLPWLPSLAGLTIDSKELTARFKQDWQQTISSLFAENYYGHLATLVNKAGMEFMVEPYGTGKVNFDINAIRGIGDMVMCEFWWGPTTWGWDSILPVASNAHVNGKKIVAAEAFTGQPQFAFRVDLFDLKSAGDRAFCNGINLFVLHASAHQPWPHLKPGMTMGWWGTQFGPSQTWWTHGAPEWIEYVSRCQMVLQKGLFVADICFLQLSKQRDPSIPAGYKADTCSPNEFLHRFDVAGNEWVLPDGMRYKILVLPADCSIDIEVAKKIEELVNKGGVVIGNGFRGSIGLKGLNTNDKVQYISGLLFGTPSATGAFEKRVRTVGKGKVYTGHDVVEVLQQENIIKDVSLPEGEQGILWIHRKEEREHYYFISNQLNAAKEVRLYFRVMGLLPELWNPETGLLFDAPVWDMADAGTNVTLNLEAYGSLFVVFRKARTTQKGLTKLLFNGKPVNLFEYLFIKERKSVIRLKEKGTYELISGTGHSQKKAGTKMPVVRVWDTDWNVTFEKGRGAPPAARFSKLISYTEHENNGIKYFSGKATYHKEFTLAADELSASKAIFIDLGLVKNVATIIVNGKKVRTFWKPPFATEITAYCKVGKNVLEVEVTNLWPNRMIGDEAEPDDLVWGKERYFTYVTPNPKIGRNLQLIPEWVKQARERPVKNRITFTTMDFFDKGDPLLPSGLLGSVKLSIETVWKVEY
ncbi:MAG: glycosyl hydrolase [Chitinophagaceae bacterium]